MYEPPFSNRDLSLAKEILQKKKVKHVLFSEGTYQVEISLGAGKQSIFPFLQLTDSGKLRDSFCTCQDAEKHQVCPHIAAAYLRIMNGKLDPLHVRFRSSFWNQIGLLCSRRLGYVSSILKKQQGYIGRSTTGKLLFSIKPLVPEVGKTLNRILFDRPVETEETSIKFSNLSQEEVNLWRQGNPSHQLQYELSFWSDLSKWWMELQDNNVPYTISFVEDDAETGLPKWVSVIFPKIVEFKIYIAEVNWPSLIPSLATVESPLEVQEFSLDTIREIIYDKEKRSFHVDFERKQKAEEHADEEPHLEGIPIKPWIYVPKKGFYPIRRDPLLEAGEVPTNKVSLFLQRYQRLLHRHLKDWKVQSSPLPARYNLFFDSEKRLHICCYVFTVGDLQQDHAARFGSWVFLPDKGFYLLEDIVIEGTEKIVPPAALSDFIERHRSWLNQQEGFQIHLSNLEPQIHYVMDDQGLRFETHLEFFEERDEILDLGEWIFLYGRGFYAKASYRYNGWIQPGRRIHPEHISEFISRHKEDLKVVKGFFSSMCPLKKIGLSIELDEEENISIRPQYFFLPNYEEKKVRILGNYTYVPKEGFFEIPPDIQLPIAYDRPRTIAKEEEPIFLHLEIDTLEPFILSLDRRLQKPQHSELILESIKADKRSAQGLWVTQLHYGTDVGNVPLFDVWRAIHEGKSYLFSPAGALFLKDPRFHWLKAISKRAWMQKNKDLKLSTLEWIQLSIYESVRAPSGSNAKDLQSRAILNKLQKLESTEEPNLEGLQSQLRPYQTTGVKWLWSLYSLGLSGMLCDEMGLGKTHQAMALLAAVHNAQVEGQAFKFLVVCPTSVIYHWEELLKRYLPKLRVCVFYGIQRTLETFNENYDLLLTSYGTLRSERKALSKIFFHLAVFDEIQTAKNVHSQTHKALRQIDAQMRLGLTGTPIENRLLEIKALFDVVLPSYFPSEAQFREVFVLPIEKNQDPERKNLLSRLIRPFVLRRKKSEVLQELPEKTEEIAVCDLSDEQRELYKNVITLQTKPIIAELHDASKPVPTMHIFSILSSLKQICNHPCLYRKDFADFHKYRSGKWDLFTELLQEARESNQKVVVFSQYLGMLDMIEMYLTEKKIGFAGIRGSTRNRKEEVERFRDDPACEVFVASLQAAGVGIDLVAASVVIHYDRWWNPAKENQATDRVHRIGQNRGVQVFKLVTKHTVEEHIDRLIKKKMALSEIVNFDDEAHIKGLTREELIELMQLLNNDLQSV